MGPDFPNTRWFGFQINLNSILKSYWSKGGHRGDIQWEKVSCRPRAVFLTPTAIGQGQWSSHTSTQMNSQTHKPKSLRANTLNIISF